MKKIILFALLCVLSLGMQAQDTKPALKIEKPQLVEASCGPCKFEMPGKDCVLAVRIAGKAYLVSGTGLDDHGDAHGPNGFCNKIRKAQVTGEVKAGRFAVKSFKLVD